MDRWLTRSSSGRLVTAVGAVAAVALLVLFLNGAVGPSAGASTEAAASCQLSPNTRQVELYLDLVHRSIRNFLYEGPTTGLKEPLPRVELWANSTASSGYKIGAGLGGFCPWARAAAAAAPNRVCWT